MDISISGGLAKQLAELGLLGDKHVPDFYLRGSAEQRLALLRGLMDADGTVWQRSGTASRVRFFNTSSRLAGAVAELGRFLGEQVLEVEYDATGFGKPVHVYQVSWTPSATLFAMAAKAARTRLRDLPSYNHRVKAIVPIDPVPTRCIAVDSPSRTFLAGTAMIPTHNTAARRLEPWVPTLAQYRREQLRATANAAAASGQGMPSSQLSRRTSTRPRLSSRRPSRCRGERQRHPPERRPAVPQPMTARCPPKTRPSGRKPSSPARARQRASDPS